MFVLFFSKNNFAHYILIISKKLMPNKSGISEPHRIAQFFVLIHCRFLRANVRQFYHPIEQSLKSFERGAYFEVLISLLKLSGEITRQNKVWYLLIHIFERLFSECNKYKKLSVFTNRQKCPKYKRIQYISYMEVIVLSGTEIILILWACRIYTRKIHASIRTSKEIRQFAAFSDYKFIASVSFLSSGIPFTSNL